eukprot:UN08285
MKNVCPTTLCAMSRSATPTENLFGIASAVTIIIISILCLIYRKYAHNTTNQPAAVLCTDNGGHNKIEIPQNNLQLWLDSTDTSTITFFNNNKNHDVLLWESKVNDIKLMADLKVSIGRNPDRSICDSKYPHYHRTQNLFIPSIFFDYQHSSTFNKTFAIQTIISLHSFEKDNGIQHEDIHGYPHNEFNNFYIFTSNKKTPFHGHSKRLFSNAALPQVRNAKIRLDAN